MKSRLEAALVLFSLAIAFAPSTSHASQNPQALAARERAEQAIGEERWCDAAHEFLRAYELSSPTVREALLNAGVAARRANDLELAASLYERFVAAHPVHRHRSTAERLAREIRAEIESEGPGITCPPAPPLPDEGPGEIIVRADAADAVVYADGELVGPAPLTFQPRSMDAVRLRVEAPGRIAFGIRVTPTREQVVVEASLPEKPPEPEPPPRPDERAAVDPPAEDPADEVREARRPDEAEVVVVVRDRPEAPPAAVSHEALPPALETDRRGRLGTVGWVLVGSGLAVAGGGGGFSWSASRAAQDLSSHLPPPGELPSREFDSELQSLEQRHETHRALGDGGLVGGGVLAGVGMILVIIDGVM